MQNTPIRVEDRAPAQESQAFWTIFLLAFSFLFVLVVLARLAGVHWREYLPGAEDAKGIPQGVQAAVYTFMSHII